MSEATEMTDRVDDLEEQVAEVRYLASKADRDVSDLRATLQGHTGVLNAIGETQREHGLKLAEHGKRLDRLERKVDKGFIMLGAGQAEIKALLNRALGEPDEEPS